MSELTQRALVFSSYLITVRRGHCYFQYFSGHVQVNFWRRGEGHPGQAFAFSKELQCRYAGKDSGQRGDDIQYQVPTNHDLLNGPRVSPYSAPLGLAAWFIPAGWFWKIAPRDRGDGEGAGRRSIQVSSGFWLANAVHKGGNGRVKLTCMVQMSSARELRFCVTFLLTCDWPAPARDDGGRDRSLYLLHSRLVFVIT